MTEVTERNAMFWTNRWDYENNVRYRILAVILDAVPANTRFRHNLGRQLYLVLADQDRPIITENFRFNRTYGYSEDIDRLISAYHDFGSAIGLENLNPDFTYRTTEKTHKIAEEIRQLGLLEEEDIAFLRSVGERLLAGRS